MNDQYTLLDKKSHKNIITERSDWIDFSKITNLAIIFLLIVRYKESI